MHLLLALSLLADWPQFLGPNRDGTVTGPKPGTTVKLLWKQDAGAGFAGPVIAGGKMLLFERVRDKEVVLAMDVNTGTKIWTFEYPTTYRDDFGFDEGPRSAPTVADGRVFTFGAEGMLTALDLATGKKLWAIDTKAKYQWKKGWFGAACAPLVEGGLVLMNIGGVNHAGIVAFDAATGKQAWTATDDEASYSSPTVATIGGERHALFLTREGLVDLEPSSGKVRFQMPWRSRNDASVNAATPLVSGDLVFVSSSYRTGAALVKVRGSKFEKVWSNDETMSNHYSTAVLKDGYLYGYHGRQENGQMLRCVELKSGKVMWSDDDFGAGSVIAVQNTLLLLRENGELVWAEATPKKLNVIARTPLFQSLVRAYPAYANGVICARSEHAVGCWRMN